MGDKYIHHSFSNALFIVFSGDIIYPYENSFFLSDI